MIHPGLQPWIDSRYFTVRQIFTLNAPSACNIAWLPIATFKVLDHHHSISHFVIWWFPNIGVPRKSLILLGGFPLKTIHLFSMLAVPAANASQMVPRPSVIWSRCLTSGQFTRRLRQEQIGRDCWSHRTMGGSKFHVGNPSCQRKKHVGMALDHWFR